MPLVVTSKQASYGDDMQSLQQGTIRAIQQVDQNMTSFNTLRTTIENDTDMTAADLAEIDALIATGYTYIWNQIKAIVPVEYQT